MVSQAARTTRLRCRCAAVGACGGRAHAQAARRARHGATCSVQPGRCTCSCTSLLHVRREVLIGNTAGAAAHQLDVQPNHQ